MLLQQVLVQWGRHRGAQLLHLAHTDVVFYTSSTTAIAATPVIAATSITTAIAATALAPAALAAALAPAAGTRSCAVVARDVFFLGRGRSLRGWGLRDH